MEVAQQFELGPPTRQASMSRLGTAARKEQTSATLNMIRDKLTSAAGEKGRQQQQQQQHMMMQTTTNVGFPRVPVGVACQGDMQAGSPPSGMLFLSRS